MRGKLTQEMTDSQKRLINAGKATVLPLIIECTIFDYHEDERRDIDITATLPNVGSPQAMKRTTLSTGNCTSRSSISRKSRNDASATQRSTL